MGTTLRSAPAPSRINNVSGSWGEGQPYFQAFPILCQIKLRIWKPMLYPLSYGSFTGLLCISLRSYCLQSTAPTREVARSSPLTTIAPPFKYEVGLSLHVSTAARCLFSIGVPCLCFTDWLMFTTIGSTDGENDCPSNLSRYAAQASNKTAMHPSFDDCLLRAVLGPKQQRRQCA